MASLNNIPFIMEYNGSSIWMSKNWGIGNFFIRITKKIEDLLLQRADLVVVVSEVMEKELLNGDVKKSSILVNPNGVNTIKYNSDLYNKEDILNSYKINSIYYFNLFNSLLL